jgi:hypothetical protein
MIEGTLNMPTTERRFGVSPARGFAIVAAMVGALGVTASGLTATPEVQADGAVQAHASLNGFRSCGMAGHDSKRFEVQRAGGGTRTIEICDARARGDLSATARALSGAIDAAPPASRLTSDPRTVDILGLRLTRARTEMNTRMDADSRNRKLTEIDDAIKRLEDEISKMR